MNAKTDSFLPVLSMAPSDDETKKPPVQVMDSSNQNFEVLKHTHAEIWRGQTPIPTLGRLTPMSQGRMKAPPVCKDLSLKRVAASIDEFNKMGLCFTSGEADSCAQKALLLNGSVSSNASTMEEMPLNLEYDSGPLWTSETKAFVSSNSTVVTAFSTSSSFQSAMGNEIADIASLTVKKDPPLEVVRTDYVLPLVGSLTDFHPSGINSDDEHLRVTSKALQPHDVVLDAIQMMPHKTSVMISKVDSSSTSLSTTFTDELVKENSSRQGRSLQRWLIHPPTGELVRQVVGTIPITRDGRIILVSASRKTEWILPKGGWDNDESKEECAARETFEEGGLLGQLGGCLKPIDYETAKARKRRLSRLGVGVAGVVDRKESKGEEEGLSPPLPKRVKTGTSISRGPELSSSTAVKVGLSESTRSSRASCIDNISTHPPAAASFDPKKYSYVRLSLFPLYVSAVKSDWPEKGRLRKLADIDEAIKIMDAQNRTYFKKGLVLLKERGLHLLEP